MIAGQLTEDGQIDSGSILFAKESDPERTIELKVVGEAIYREAAPSSVENNLFSDSPLIGLISRLLAPLAALAATVPVAASAATGLLSLPFVPAWTRRRAAPWGRVLNRQTGRPITGSLIRLFETEFGRQISQILTDRQGRFGFKLEETGSFFIIAQAPNYQTVKTDKLTIKSPDRVFSAWTIKLEPTAEASSRLRAEKIAWLSPALYFLNLARRPILILGTGLALIAPLLIGLNFATKVGLIFYALLWLLEYRLSRRRPTFGTVTDRQTGQALPLTIIRAYRVVSGQFRLAETTVADFKGNYQLLVQPGRLFFHLMKPGYQALKTRPQFRAGLKTQIINRFHLSKTG